MARLTWKNMQAPDFRDVAEMQAQAGQSFSQGFSGLGDIAGGINNRNIQAAAMERKRMDEAAAMERKRMDEAMMQAALANSDPTQDGNWARTIGAGPASMIKDMSESLESQSGQYTSRVDRGQTIVDTAADKFELGQDIIAAQRAEEVYQRQEQERVIGLMDEAMMQAALANSDPTQDGNWANVIGAGPASMIGDMNDYLKSQSGQYNDRTDRGKKRADTANVIVDTATDKFALSQDVTEYNTGLENKALQDKANQDMHEMSLGFGSPDNFIRAVEQMPGTFKEKELLRKAAEGVSSTNFNANPEGVSEFRSGAEFTDIQDVIRSERESAIFARNADDTLRYYEMGLSTDGSATVSAQDALLEEARTVVGEDEVPKYENTIGEMAREINSLSKDPKYKSLPKALIIGVMREHVRSADSAFWSNETIETDMGAVTSALDNLIAAKPRLSEDLANYERQQEKLSEWEQKLQKEEARYGVAYDKTGKVGEKLRQDSLNNLTKLHREIIGEPDSSNAAGSGIMPLTFPRDNQPISDVKPALIDPLDNLEAGTFYKESVAPTNGLPPSLQGTALFENAFIGSASESALQTQNDIPVEAISKELKSAGLGDETVKQYTTLLEASKNRTLTSREQKFLDDVETQLRQRSDKASQRDDPVETILKLISTEELNSAGINGAAVELYKKLLEVSKNRTLTLSEQDFQALLKNRLTQRFGDRANSILTGPGNR